MGALKIRTKENFTIFKDFKSFFKSHYNKLSINCSDIDIIDAILKSGLSQEIHKKFFKSLSYSIFILTEEASLKRNHLLEIEISTLKNLNVELEHELTEVKNELERSKKRLDAINMDVLF